MEINERTSQFLKYLGNGRSLAEIEAEESYFDELEFGKEEMEDGKDSM